MKSKKLVTLALSAIMAFAMTITAFAATAATDKEKILKALNDAKVDAKYVTQAEQFLADNTVTADQATAVVKEINNAATTANGKLTLKDMTAAQKTAIKANITNAAAAVGATAKFDVNTDEVTITKGTNTYVAGANVGKATGVSTYATVTVIAGLAIVLVACGVVVSKRKFA